MKILYLVNKYGGAGYFNKMSRVRFHGMESIGEISDLTWWGPGWEGYDNTISVSDNLEKLENLSKKYQFNLNFEGGEAETFVINCPLFKNKIKIIDSKKIWDGIRGRFEIVEAELENNA